VLTLRRTTTDGFEIDRDPRFEVVLANRSIDKSYPIVLPSDGSEAGWREPHVFYTVERRTAPSAAWEVAPPEQLIRCGNYDVDWAKDVVALEPGKEVILPWFGFHHQWNLDGASYVRVTAHYVYGDHARDWRKVPPVLHTTPAYAIASNAMELAIEAPLSLEVSWKGSLPKAGDPLARSFEVVAINRGKTELPFATADTGANLTIEVEGQGRDGTTEIATITSGVSVGNAKERIAAGGRRNVVGASKALDDFAGEANASGEFRPRRVRASLHVWWYTDEANGKSDERVARSAWTTVP
jgi:hypothetical protein